MTSPMRTSLVTRRPVSLTPPLMPVWLWQSIRPGVTWPPWASMTRAPSGTGASASGPT